MLRPVQEFWMYLTKFKKQAAKAKMKICRQSNKSQKKYNHFMIILFFSTL